MASQSDKFDKIAKFAMDKSNEELANEISDLSKKMSPELIEKLFPTQPDKAELAKLAQLMSIVSERSGQNRRTANLIENIGELGDVVVHILRKSLL
jgi:hypothetical protein